MLKKLAIQLSFLFLPILVQAEEVKIGAVLGLTGPASVWAENARAGIELAVSEVNKESGGAGRKFRIIFEDSRSTPLGATTAFKKLVDQDRVGLVIGDVWAFLTVPLISLADSHKVILISPTVMDRSIPNPSEYYFSLGHRFETLREPLRKFFRLNPQVKRVATLSFDDYWNNAFIEIFSQAAKESGVEVVTTLKGSDFNPDFRTEITLLRKSAVDAVLSTWRPEVVLQRMREQKFNVPYVCSSDAVEAILVRSKDRRLFEGMYFTDWLPAPGFVERFTKSMGKEPLFEAQNSYEVVRSIAKAFEQDAPDLRAALARVVYEGVEGQIDFRNTHFPNMGAAQLFRVQNGSFVRQ